MLHIVLVAPSIPQNTGNIGRLCAATNSRLHLVEPLGFEISDSKLKRAGLDYWPLLDWRRYPNWDDFLSTNPGARMWFFTTRATLAHYKASFQDEDYLVLGNEQTGLSEWFHQTYQESLLTIPFDNPGVRSMNVGNAAAVALFEARRQLSQEAD